MRTKIKISKGEFLYERNDSYFIRNEKGEIEKIPKNKFYHGQIVKTTDKHFSQKTFTSVVEPNYTEQRGWIYGEGYLSRNDGRGGFGYWNEEDLFEEITSPGDILYAERIYLMNEIRECKNNLKNAEDKLEKIEFALSVSIPDWKNVHKKCHLCGKLYLGSEGDVNISICNKCKDLEKPENDN